jgi:hypothetical protein
VIVNELQIEFGEMRWCVRRPLFAPDLSDPTAQQSDDFLLNLRIVQQAQKTSA